MPFSSKPLPGSRGACREFHMSCLGVVPLWEELRGHGTGEGMMRGAAAYSLSSQERCMNILLWVLQVLLALAFLAHGWLLLAPPANLIEQMNEIMSTEFRIFLGTAEVLAAVGL